MQTFPDPDYFPTLWSKCSPQHTGLKHRQCMFLPYGRDIQSKVIERNSERQNLSTFLRVDIKLKIINLHSDFGLYNILGISVHEYNIYMLCLILRLKYYTRVTIGVGTEQVCPSSNVSDVHAGSSRSEFCPLDQIT
jgi:hypothetical protein